VSRSLVPIAIACVLAAVPGGCGGGRSDADQVKATLARFQTAAGQHDYAAICDDVLSRELLAKLRTVGLQCELALRQGLESRADLRLRVRRVSIHGDRALAEVQTTAQGERPSTDTLQLVKEKAGWRVTSLSGAKRPAAKRGAKR
jgi:hypothetical protein